MNKLKWNVSKMGDRTICELKEIPNVENVKFDNNTVELARNYIRMVGQGDILGCTLLGEAGMGKTHLVRETLEGMNVDYEIYGGHITLAEIYEFLYEYRTSVIFFDDVSQVINKIEIMEMLKQALNLSEYERVLHYRSKMALSHGVPTNFSFKGRIIFAFNKMEKNNPNVKAIMDRAPVIELKFSFDEKMRMFDKIAGSDEQRLTVVNYLKEHINPRMDVSLRKLFLSFKIYKSFINIYGIDNIRWKTQVKSLFKEKKELWIVKLVRLNGESIKRVELVKQIALNKDVSPRTAQRKVSEFIELGVLKQNKKRGGQISVA